MDLPKRELNPVKVLEVLARRMTDQADSLQRAQLPRYD